MFECKNELSLSNIENLKYNSNIPIIVIAFNNLTYVKNMLKQLENKKIKSEDIWIWDNNSTAPALLAFYEQISTKYNLVKNNANYGPRFFAVPYIFDLLPDFFAVTDPDLSFNEKMSDNFLEYLKQLTIELSLFKAGLALDIIPTSNFNRELMSNEKCTVTEWEMQYWLFPITKYNKPKVFNAGIDTTFAVYNKKFISNGFYNAVRVADNFTCKHLPWYKDNIISEEEKNMLNTKWANWH